MNKSLPWRMARNTRSMLPGWLDERMFPLVERMTGFPRERRRVAKNLGYVPDLKRPRSFNEKLLWKKLYDHDPLLPVIADKVRVREYVRHVLGHEVADQILIPLLFVTEQPETIPFDTLPEEYIIKANHASGWNQLVEKGSTVDRAETIAKCQCWLRRGYGYGFHEWHYQKIRPRRVLIEPLLRDEYGEIPKDFKFFFFYGKFKMLQVDLDRFQGHSRALYGETFDRLNVQFAKTDATPNPQLPMNIEEMVDLGSRIAAHFDFMRVDLYLIKGRVFFGELTAFPENSGGNFTPTEYDFLLGENWDLEPGYWKKRDSQLMALTV